MYYKNADAVIIIYDVQNRSSFQDCFRYWLPEVEGAIKSDTPIFLIGNKIDLPNQIVPIYEVQTQVNKRPNAHQINVLETSMIDSSQLAKLAKIIISNLASKNLGINGSEK